MCESLFTLQSYDEKYPFANILAIISLTSSDNRPLRRQIASSPSKLVLS